jgi:hypothetical protein
MRQIIFKEKGLMMKAQLTQLKTVLSLKKREMFLSCTMSKIWLAFFLFTIKHHCKTIIKVERKTEITVIKIIFLSAFNFGNENGNLGHCTFCP